MNHKIIIFLFPIFLFSCKKYVTEICDITHEKEVIARIYDLSSFYDNRVNNIVRETLNDCLIVTLKINKSLSDNLLAYTFGSIIIQNEVDIYPREEVDNEKQKLYAYISLKGIINNDSLTLIPHKNEFMSINDEIIFLQNHQDSDNSYYLYDFIIPNINEINPNFSEDLNFYFMTLNYEYSTDIEIKSDDYQKLKTSRKNESDIIKNSYKVFVRYSNQNWSFSKKVDNIISKYECMS